MQFAAMTNFNEERLGINRDETEKNSFRHFVSVDTKRSFARTSRLNARSGRGYDAFFFYQRAKARSERVVNVVAGYRDPCEQIEKKASHFYTLEVKVYQVIPTFPPSSSSPAGFTREKLPRQLG